MEPRSVLSLEHPAAKLRLQPQAEAAGYDAAATWEEYANGVHNTATVAKQISLDVRQVGGHYEIDFQTQAPAIAKKDDLQPLEQVALRLAALYEWVVVKTSATGQFLDVLNHAQMLRTWEVLQADLRAATTDDDAVTQVVVEQIGKQLEDKANVLRSLQHDYLYETLVKNMYNQAFALGRVYSQARKFSQFFAGTDLWFAEQLEVEKPRDDAELVLVFRGKIDAEQTDVASIGRAIAAVLDANPPPAGQVPVAAAPETVPAPHFGYEARYEVEKATGLPAAVELTVYARLLDVYNKQYTLILRHR